MNNNPSEYDFDEDDVWRVAQAVNIETEKEPLIPAASTVAIKTTLTFASYFFCFDKFTAANLKTFKGSTRYTYTTFRTRAS